MKSKRNLGKMSREQILHFQCWKCKKWWAIGDAPKDKKEWYCPWCGQKQEFVLVDRHDIITS